MKVSDPIAYVVSLNLHRRQLTPGQVAMIAAKARELYEREAKERQKGHGGTAPGKKTLPANLPEVSGDARDLAGKAFGISGYCGRCRQLAKFFQIAIDPRALSLENGPPD